MRKVEPSRETRAQHCCDCFSLSQTEHTHVFETHVVSHNTHVVENQHQGGAVLLGEEPTIEAVISGFLPGHSE